MSQKEFFEINFPHIFENGDNYSKFGLVLVRIAEPKEYIETWTEDGLETTNYAKIGDYVVQNLYTAMREDYIVSADMMFQRYEFVCNLDAGGIYKPKGKVKASIYSGEEIKFVAKWGRMMTLKPGDMIVTPLPGCKEVYRIAAKEFYESYILV